MIVDVNEYYTTLEEKSLFATNFLQLQNVVCNRKAIANDIFQLHTPFFSCKN
jgi:hypothetical protein